MLLLKLILPFVLFTQSMPNEIQDKGIVVAVTPDSVSIGGYWFPTATGFNDFSDVTFPYGIKDRKAFPFYAEVTWEPLVLPTGHAGLTVRRIAIIEQIKNEGTQEW